MEEFTRFLVEEWKKPHYGTIIGTSALYISHCGKCDEDQRGQQLQTEVPNYPKGRLKEADTLIAFYPSSVSSGNILVSACCTVSRPPTSSA